MAATRWNKLNRQVHFWASILVFIPLTIVIITGILLLFKKDFSWIQPPTQKAHSYVMDLTFPEILKAAKKAKQSNIRGWQDIDRLDVRPSRGIVKVRGNNRWEVQLSLKDGEILSVMHRKSDLIETIHDGSWFHDSVKYSVFLPAAVILLIMLITGMYLFVVTLLARHRVTRRRAQRHG